MDGIEVLNDGFVPLRVHSVARDTDDSVVVELDTTEQSVTFAHGQHLTLRRRFDDVEVRRSYSICSPAPSGALRVAIKHVPGGVFSTWALKELQAGDEIDVLPPAGHFTHDLDAAAARHYTLLAAGSGITPVFSIAATILEHEPRSIVDLLYVNRTSLSTMLLDDLHDLRDRHLGRLRLNFPFTR
jgi:ring-1,2-phenylacetyl-CoA epoxidase subunit PaaE